MANYKLIISNVLLGTGLATSPLWLGAATLGTVMANDSDAGREELQALGLYSIYSTPFVLLFSLGYNIKYKKYNSFISAKLPLIPIVSYVGLMYAFFQFPKKKGGFGKN